MASPLPRRWPLFVVLACTSLLVLYQLHEFGNTSAQELKVPESTDPSLSNTSDLPQPTINNELFRWEDRPTHFPLPSLTAIPTGTPERLPLVQHAFDPESQADRNLRLTRRKQVKAAFERSWKSYRSMAWMRDELLPISGGGQDTFGGWAATLVDALDTLWIMDLKDEFHEAVAASANIDFSTSANEKVNIFETSIRYLGGFLSAYDLSGDKNLLRKAVEVGEMLLVAFDTPNHMPVTPWDWERAADGVRKQVAPTFMLVAELGSLSLEFTRLSQLTGDQRWYDAVHRITSLFDAQQEKTHLPGLWPAFVNPKNEDLTNDRTFTFGGMSDSVYETLPKEYALLGGLEPTYQKLYEQSMAASIKHLLFRPMTPTNEDILLSGDARVEYGGVELQPRSQHLSCFAGGMFALGGRLFSNESHVEIGRKLTDGCVWAYESMPYGVMPEIAHFVACPSKESCTWNTAMYHSAVLQQITGSEITSSIDEIIAKKNLPLGFTRFEDRRYVLRPEAIESVFIMYRITGDKSYQETAWRMFESITNMTETEFAYAGLMDTTAMGDQDLPNIEDRMESFWLSETLKYFYLIFSEPDLISLDEFVLSTEAHPFRRPLDTHVLDMPPIQELQK